jgi:glutaredoxin
MTKLLVECYGKKDCCLCKEAKEVIGRVREEIPFQFKEVDIQSSEDLFRRYKEDVPTIFINGKKAFKFKVDEEEFRKKVRKEFIKAGIVRVWNKSRGYNS